MNDEFITDEQMETITTMAHKGFGISDIAAYTKVPNYLVRMVITEYVEGGYEKLKEDF